MSKKVDTTLRIGSVVIALAASWMLSGQTANAVPVKGQFVNDPTHCDDPADIVLTHELGDAAVFPVDEQLLIDLQPTNAIVCVSDDGIANDYNIRMVNIGSIYWTDVHFVADEGIDFSLGNWDGFVSDTIAPGFTNAFRIDAVGTNANLIGESITADGIFEPGEEWTFLVSNFGLSPSQAPVFDSVGAFSVSSPLGPPSTASILANPVPEPGTLAVLGVGVIGFLARRRRARGR